MALASWEARYDEQHKDMPYHDGTFKNWSAERTDGTPFHYRDGVTIWPASMDLNPDDDFLGTGSTNQPPHDDGERPESHIDPD